MQFVDEPQDSNNRSLCSSGDEPELQGYSSSTGLPLDDMSTSRSPDTKLPDRNPPASEKQIPPDDAEQSTSNELLLSSLSKPVVTISVPPFQETGFPLSHITKVSYPFIQFYVCMEVMCACIYYMVCA